MRRTARAWLASAVHLALAPGLVALVGPWLVTGWQVGAHPAYLDPLRWLGLAVATAAGVTVVAEFVRFARAGGSPAPPVPTASLVTGGLYAHVRNPMYVAVVAAIAGQSLWFVDIGLAAYAVVAAAVMATFVRLYEEPALQRQFGATYAAYCAEVPRWWPRWRAAAVSSSGQDADVSAR